MVSLRKIVSRYVLHKMLLHLQWRVSRARHESETVAHTEHVRIDDYDGKSQEELHS